jgi:hypothetical protein
MATLRVMTWNLENLFAPDRDDGPAEAQFQRKLGALATLIDGVRPHLLALQEVGPEDALGRLQAALGHAMPHAAAGIPDDRGIRVALLSTEELTDIRHLRAFPGQVRPVQVRDPVFDDPATAGDEALTARMGRGGLEAGITLGGIPVRILTAHFKSKLIGYERRPGLVRGHPFQPNDEGERCRYAAYALSRRTGEALTIRQRLNEILAGTGRDTAVIFCGDLNDGVDAATTQILQGPPGSEIATEGFSRADQGDGFRMWNLAPLLPEVDGGPAYTRVYRGRRELIDHIFASRALVDPGNLPRVQTLAASPLPSIGDDPRARAAEPASDHAAVVAEFTLGGAG